jgi:hypothetical protein
MKPELFLSIEVGSDTKSISEILNLLPYNCEGVKYYDIGDICKRDKHIYKESFYRYRYYNDKLFDANLFVECLFQKISLEVIKKILFLNFDILLVFNINIPQSENIYSLPDAGLSSDLMKILGTMGIDYHVQISVL